MVACLTGGTAGGATLPALPVDATLPRRTARRSAVRVDAAGGWVRAAGESAVGPCADEGLVLKAPAANLLSVERDAVRFRIGTAEAIAAVHRIAAFLAVGALAANRSYGAWLVIAARGLRGQALPAAARIAIREALAATADAGPTCTTGASASDLTKPRRSWDAGSYFIRVAAEVVAAFGAGLTPHERSQTGTCLAHVINSSPSHALEHALGSIRRRHTERWEVWA
jgi:hypothetical protein